MALIKCNECRNLISKTAKSCPQCGAAPEKKMGILSWIILGMFTVWIASLVLSPSPPSQQRAVAQAEPAELTPEEVRRQEIAVHFRPSGAHRALERMIRSSLHNPDSYEHVETLYVDQGDHLLLQTTYRGTNGFGGIVTDSTLARADLNGNVLEILEE